MVPHDALTMTVDSFIDCSTNAFALWAATRQIAVAYFLNCQSSHKTQATGPKMDTCQESTCTLTLNLYLKEFFVLLEAVKQWQIHTPRLYNQAYLNQQGMIPLRSPPVTVNTTAHPWLVRGYCMSTKPLCISSLITPWGEALTPWHSSNRVTFINKTSVHYFTVALTMKLFCTHRRRQGHQSKAVICWQTLVFRLCSWISRLVFQPTYLNMRGIPYTGSCVMKGFAPRKADIV